MRELRHVKASELIPNPKNWRKHPMKQRQALQAVLDEVGIAGAMLARETAQGLQLIDGHLRASLSEDEMVPVLVLDVNEQEADKLLATYDPLSAMAEKDAELAAELAGEIETESEALRDLLAQVAGVEPPFMPEVETPVIQEEEDYSVTVTCRDADEQKRLAERLTSDGYLVRRGF